MYSFKNSLSNVFGILALIFGICAVGVLVLQVWSWISNGAWPNYTIGQGLVYFHMPVPDGHGLYEMVALGLISTFPLFLGLALLVLGCGGVKKILGG